MGLPRLTSKNKYLKLAEVLADTFDKNNSKEKSVIYRRNRDKGPMFDGLKLAHEKSETVKVSWELWGRNQK